METSNFRNIRIGDVLKEQGYVTEEQLQLAVQYQQQNKGVRLGTALVSLGIITERQMLEALAKSLRYSLINIADITVDMKAVNLIPQQTAEKYCMLGVSVNNGTMTLVVNDPLNFYGIEDIRQITGLNLNICIAEKQQLETAIHYYYTEVAARNAVNKANTSNIGQAEIESMTIDAASDDDTPIINLLNTLIQRAYSTNASDIHIEPFEKESTVRMRVDGVVVDFVTLNKNLHAPLIARIKILSDLDIAERRIPQDGHFRINVSGININIRVSVIPTVFGEKAVLRLLATNGRIDNPGTFGMRDDDYRKFSKMIQSPNGLIYITGPTGSGKSTTLYMVLGELSQKPVNISTIEDPVEKNIVKLNQMQVNNTAGLTFEVGLRALLRQDPDIIMVGETRDAETASISVRAAITGHLVFSTLHTNDAASSVVRLIDMGLEPYMVASALVGIVAQRLMRKVCPLCAEDADMTPDEVKFVGRPLAKVKRAKGCNSCNYTGYRGRIAIHEILEVDKTMSRMITSGASVEDIRQYAVEHFGMKLLKDRGIELVEQGITTIEELRKIAFYS